MPPKPAMAKPAAQRASKRKAAHDSADDTSSALKKRRQNGIATAAKKVDSDEEDAGFAFTRPAKATKKAIVPPTRSSPRNHPSTRQSFIAATPKVTKPAVESNFRGLSNASDSFVALPVSDTPIIRKNQQLRQGGGDGRRRSSLSMRGKRASSMGNGFQSVPHPDIPATEFYKHISEDLPDPLRMKQLLAWCARRIIDDSRNRPTTDKAETDEQLQAANIAKTIEEEVLKDLIENKITTSWYHRQDQEIDTTEKRPHPQNVANAQKLQEMELRMQKLEEEGEAWSQILERQTASSTKATIDQPTERFAKKTEQAVDLDLLSAAEAEFVHSLTSRSETNLSLAGAPTTAVALDDWLRDAETNLEFNVDSLRHSLHRQQQYLKQADAQGSKLLEGASKSLAAIEMSAQSQSKEKGISTIDILRQISRRG